MWGCTYCVSLLLCFMLGTAGDGEWFLGNTRRPDELLLMIVNCAGCSHVREGPGAVLVFRPRSAGDLRTICAQYLCSGIYGTGD